MVDNGKPIQFPSPIEPPPFCKYAEGPCDQNYEDALKSDVLFLYPSQPEFISNTIEETVTTYRKINPNLKILTWKDLNISGKIIFCEICKAIRFTKLIYADVTTLNFNLLFEIGYAIGLGIPVIPIRDTTVVKDKKQFDELGLLDTTGYVDFQNSKDLLKSVINKNGTERNTSLLPSLNKEAPL